MISAEVIEQLDQPWIAVLIGGERGGKGQEVDVRHDLLGLLFEPCPEGWIGDDGEGAAEPGDIERLAGRHQGDGAARSELNPAMGM